MKQVLIGLVLVWNFCATSHAEQVQQNPPTQGVPDFIIGAQDVLAINVWREPDFTVRAVVRPDGRISVPLLNDIEAAGLTPKELTAQITAGLQKFVTEPVVSVIVVEIHSHSVHVIGSVGRGGNYDLNSPLTIVQLLARAGGFTDLAKSRDVVIVRTEAGKTRRFRFNFDTFASGQNFQQNITLHSGDVIIIQ